MDVVAYARQTLSPLRGHLRQAREIEAKIGANYGPDAVKRHAAAARRQRSPA